MASKINHLLKKIKSKKLKLAFAESMTCGLISYKLNTLKNTNDFFSGSVICYDKNVKMKLLRVPPLLIYKYSDVSKQVTEVLARNLSGLIRADLYGAVTGLATSDQTSNHKKGTVFLSVYNGTKVKTVKHQFRGTPLQIKKKATYAMLKLMGSVV